MTKIIAVPGKFPPLSVCTCQIAPRSTVVATVSVSWVSVSVMSTGTVKLVIVCHVHITATTMESVPQVSDAMVKYSMGFVNRYTCIHKIFWGMVENCNQIK